MRCRLCALFFATLTVTGCRGGAGQPELENMAPARASAVEQNVRAFTRDVARDVTAEGPVAWTRYFENDPAFFMAVDGKVAFPSGAAAKASMPSVAQMYRHIDLHWGDDLRVDPLSPTLAGMATSWHEVVVDAKGQQTDASGFFSAVAEYRDGRWQFRNAHWSTIVPKTP